MELSFNTMKSFKSTHSYLHAYTLLVSLTFIIALFLKVFLPVDAEVFGKWSWVTGFPFLRTQQLLKTYLLNLFIVVHLVLIYSFDKENLRDGEKADRAVSFLFKIKLGHLIQNTLPILALHVLFLSLRKVLYHHTSFRLSGHYMITMFSIFIISQLKSLLSHTLDHMKLRNEKMLVWIHFYDVILTLFLIHHFYTLIFTCWIYHSIYEAVGGYLLAVVTNYFISHIKVDEKICELLTQNYTDDNENIIEDNLVSEGTQYNLIPDAKE